MADIQNDHLPYPSNLLNNFIIKPIPFNIYLEFMYVEHFRRSFNILEYNIMPKWPFSHLVVICHTPGNLLNLVIDI